MDGGVPKELPVRVVPLVGEGDAVRGMGGAGGEGQISDRVQPAVRVKSPVTGWAKSQTAPSFCQPVKV